MNQLRDYADKRLLAGCVYCGGPDDDTRDHVPSKVLLDAPLPANLPIVPSCCECNNGFSLDEEYLACLIEAAVTGSTDPDFVRRSKVADILKQNQGLRFRLEAAKRATAGPTVFAVEADRVKTVLLKLARGHAAYELSRPLRHAPLSFAWRPLAEMTREEWELFDDGQLVDLFSEVGSRQSQRLVTQVVLNGREGTSSVLGIMFNDWVDVQEGRYRYHAAEEGDFIRVKMVLSDYLACEVIWRTVEGISRKAHPTRMSANPGHGHKRC